jgi:hypothetical protein
MKILIFYGITIEMVKTNILQQLHVSSTSQESLLTSVVASYKGDDAQGILGRLRRKGDITIIW